jgi:hypothetical protein
MLSPKPSRDEGRIFPRDMPEGRLEDQTRGIMVRKIFLKPGCRGLLHPGVFYLCGSLHKSGAEEPVALVDFLHK